MLAGDPGRPDRPLYFFCTNDKLLDASGEPTGVYRWEIQKSNGRWLECRDTALRWLDGRMVRLQFAVDITTRKKAEESLRQSEKLLEMTQRLTKIGGWEWDRQKQAMYWTKELYRIHGFDPEKVDPRSFDHIKESMLCFAPGDRPALQEALLRWRDAGAPFDLELPLTKKTGERIWVRARGETVYDQGDTRFLGSIMDITEQKKVERQLEQAREKAEAASRFKSEFLATMSHELRTAMHGVTAMAELLLKTRLTPEQQEYASIIQDSAEILLNLINDVLDISKIEAGYLKLKAKIKEAVEENRICAYFQPIVNNGTGRVEKYECLARMLGSDGTEVPAASFLEVAKKTVFFREIIKTVMRDAFNVFARTPFEFTVNISAGDINDQEIRQFIFSMLGDNPDASARLTFEILESEGIHNFAEVKAFIGEVKEYGCRVAIDDFGSGYSNFAHILSLDVDYLKIDGSLIRNIHQDQKSAIITASIVNVARHMGLQTVAEFVHCRGVFEKSRELGVDFFQGYFFGTPARTVKGLA